MLCFALLALFLASLADLANFATAKRLAGRGHHFLMLQRDGQVFAVGHDRYGQLGLNTTTNAPLPQAMLSVINATDISAGSTHSCLIDSQVKCTGNNDNYQLGDVTSKANRMLLLPVTGLDSDFVEIHAGAYGSCVMTASGKAQCWGQFAGPAETFLTNITISGGIQSMSLGYEHTCFVAVGGKLYCMGSNKYSQLGTGNTTNQAAPTQVVGLAAKDIVSVACGYYHACAVNKGGAMFCWGGYGRLGNPTVTAESPVPIQVLGITSGTASAWTGWLNSFALMQNGTVWAFGMDVYGVFGTGSTGKQLAPVVFGQGVSGVMEIRGGFYSTCVLLQNDAVWCTGDNHFGQLGVGNNLNSTTLVEMVGIPATQSPTISPTSSVPTTSPTSSMPTIAPTSSMPTTSPTSSMPTTSPTSSVPTTSPTAFPTRKPTTKRLAGRGDHFLMLQRDGRVFGVGLNNHGQLGLDTTTNALLPQPMLSVTNATDVSVGAYHSCLIDQGSQVKCTGQNLFYQLGDGTKAEKHVLVPMRGLSSESEEIYSGESANCVRTTSGKAQCWGFFANSVQAYPYTIIISGGIQSVSLGHIHICFVAGGGKLFCAGANQNSQLGTGDTKSHTALTQVVGLAAEGIVSVACANFHTCAVNAVGAMFCWGFAESGRLGNSSVTEPSSIPVQVAGITSGAVSAWTGGYNSFALMQNGTVLAFGADLYGVFGTGSAGVKYEPIAFGQGVSGVVEVCGGYQATCVLLQNDTVWCAGNNQYGQLGVGSNAASQTLVEMRLPTKQPTLTPAVEPTVGPTLTPTTEPTLTPTTEPTLTLTTEPTLTLTTEPTLTPTTEPTLTPTSAPSNIPVATTSALDGTDGAVAPDQDIGAIAGGVVGAVALLLLGAGAFVMRKRHLAKRRADEALIPLQGGAIKQVID
ncbi:hypothetical protein BASA81_005925 [Batrachochytrium salamandrivorans]|nr:hypothetical protein BASA81_005925 [Batrachochytrium salamandrivorans]